MTPCQKIKREILNQLGVQGVTEDSVDSQYASAQEPYDLGDVEDEFRSMGETTDIPAPSSRHYESRSVARKCIDGSWVGWTYWYGGGKHGQPGEIDWMIDAYDLNVREEEKTVTIRVYSKGESP